MPTTVPMRYVPKNLSKRDKTMAKKELKASRKLYKKGLYHTRKHVKSFHSQESKHIRRAREIYGIDNILPNPLLAKKTGCSVPALLEIVKKGEGAYFSSGSRPNQSAQSWGYARLASAVTGGKASAVDYSILSQGCTKKSKALKLANQSIYYNKGHRRTKHITL